MCWVRKLKEHAEYRAKCPNSCGHHNLFEKVFLIEKEMDVKVKVKKTWTHGNKLN